MADLHRSARSFPTTFGSCASRLRTPRTFSQQAASRPLPRLCRKVALPIPQPCPLSLPAWRASSRYEQHEDRQSGEQQEQSPGFQIKSQESQPWRPPSSPASPSAAGPAPPVPSAFATGHPGISASLRAVLPAHRLASRTHPQAADLGLSSHRSALLSVHVQPRSPCNPDASRQDAPLDVASRRGRLKGSRLRSLIERRPFAEQDRERVTRGGSKPSLACPGHTKHEP